jgi:hypothetical protein
MTKNSDRDVKNSTDSAKWNEPDKQLRSRYPYYTSIPHMKNVMFCLVSITGTNIIQTIFFTGSENRRNLSAVEHVCCSDRITKFLSPVGRPSC